MRTSTQTCCHRIPRTQPRRRPPSCSIAPSMLLADSTATRHFHCPHIAQHQPSFLRTHTTRLQTAPRLMTTWSPSNSTTPKTRRCCCSALPHSHSCYLHTPCHRLQSRGPSSTRRQTHTATVAPQPIQMDRWPRFDHYAHCRGLLDPKPLHTYNNTNTQTRDDTHKLLLQPESEALIWIHCVTGAR